MHMLNESLYDIPNFPDYKVTKNLRVWSCRAKRFLKCSPPNYRVSVYVNGVRKVFSKRMLNGIIHPPDITRFKHIPGIEGYMASKFGEIYSIKQKRIMKPSIDSYGYEVVAICQGSKENSKTMKVHRLVALTFVPNSNNYETVDHLDNNPLNNCAENLEWVTPQENTHRQWARRRGF